MSKRFLKWKINRSFSKNRACNIYSFLEYLPKNTNGRIFLVYSIIHNSQCNALSQQFNEFVCIPMETSSNQKSHSFERNPFPATATATIANILIGRNLIKKHFCLCFWFLFLFLFLAVKAQRTKKDKSILGVHYLVLLEQKLR